MAEPSPKAFQPYRKVQASNEAQLRYILERTAIAIAKRLEKLPRGVGGQVREAQLRTTLAAITRLRAAMWVGRIGPLVRGAMEAAENASEDAIETMTRVAYAALPDQVAQTLVDGLRAAAESGLKSDALRKRRVLSEKIYKSRAVADNKIEQIIRTGIISGLSAKELAADVYKYVSPSAPGGEAYVALRLARTEINNAFHERQIAGAKRPGVEAVQWNLSGSHKVPDECNVYAKHKPYPPDEVPDKPHPQCFCYLTYVTMSSEEFRDKLAAGDFDAEIDRRTRENMARLGQPVGDVKPVESTGEPLSGQKAHDSVPKGLFKRGTMTAPQRKSLQTYESGWFMVIQDFLRGKKWNDPEYVDEQRDVSNIDGAMEGSVLSQDIQAYRGMFNSQTVFGDRLSNDLTGFAWEDAGYGSVTTQQKLTRVFITGHGDGSGKPVPDSVVMDVRVKAGTRALETSTQTQGSKENGPQAEITLQRGTRWKVVKDNGTDAEGVRHLEVEVGSAG